MGVSGRYHQSICFPKKYLAHLKSKSMLTCDWGTNTKNRATREQVYPTSAENVTLLWHTTVPANSKESLLWLVCMFAIHHSCEIGISGIPKCRLQAPAEWGMCCESSTRNHRSQSFFKQKFAFKCFLFLAIGKKASKTKLMSHFALFSPEPPFPMSSPFVNCTIMLSVLSHAG